MAYRTDKFEVGDSIEWTEESRKKFTDTHGEGPFIIKRIEKLHDSLFHAAKHTQFVFFDGDEDCTFSGYHFRKVKKGPSEEEIRAIAMTEIARRLDLAKLALLQVDFDYDLRKGFISSDTMQTVTRALELLR